MFSSAMPSPFGRPQTLHAYRQMAAQTGVVDASPHRLVAMLYDGLMDAIAEARGAMRQQDIIRKGRAIGRATGIVEEGLRGRARPAGRRHAWPTTWHRLYGYVGAAADAGQSAQRQRHSRRVPASGAAACARPGWPISPTGRRPDAAEPFRELP
jgi:hypothetical protein